ncbi:hypothetical protein AQUCO_00700765v1 [Aquilegia coerulea]|uniref:KIB1-4 beta-propeller domain-containing protein n=1 Tax=Aquilegia coerulea TaxID=218851 RepID=A0A2G5ELL6_AQUCA|nr:hypothetical protein AQUCO_00700765v1 [Aquilegia coerulea]
MRPNFLVKKAIISSSPSLSTETSSCIVMVIYHFTKRLAFARPVKTPVSLIVDIIFFRNQFYAINFHGTVIVCDIGDGLDSPKASEVVRNFPRISRKEPKYLVECSGELLAVVKCVLKLIGNDEEEKEINLPAYKTEKFEVYRLDFANKKWEEVNSLGDY